MQLTIFFTLLMAASAIAADTGAMGRSWTTGSRLGHLTVVVVCVYTVLFVYQRFPPSEPEVKIVRVETLERATSETSAGPQLPAEQNLTDERMARLLFDYLEYPETCCRRLEQYGGILYGGHLDGNKFVCQNEAYKLEPKHCLVYSVGISNEWSFDKQITSYGCQVHAFDPSMANYKLNRTDFGAYFYKIGLAGKTAINSKGWHMATLTDIRQRLGHQEMVIDYLKVDIEGSEWGFMESDIQSLKHVRQMGMEIHMKMTQLRRYYSIFYSLQQLGFATVHSEPNKSQGKNGKVAGVPYAVGGFYELVWVNKGLAN